MIIDVRKFAETEEPYWNELEAYVRRLEAGMALQIDDVKRIHYLYQRTSSDLVKLTTFAANSAIEGYLGSLVSRAYAVIHESRSRRGVRPLHWLLVQFPQSFRRRFRVFLVSAAVLSAGILFGIVSLSIDTRAKDAILGAYPHLRIDPSERVAKELRKQGRQSLGTAGAAWYFTHNTKVSILAMALGFTYGVGTVILLFSNGVLLGAVIIDYVNGGCSGFVTAWLLPHGAVEIPAILIGAQAGLVLAHALIGWGRRQSLRQRLSTVRRDVVNLSLGSAVFLIWAGGVESWFSQWHGGLQLTYTKIAIGLINLVLVILFLGYSGRNQPDIDELEDLD